MTPSYQAALAVAQQSICLLLQWTEPTLQQHYSVLGSGETEQENSETEQKRAVERAKELLSWTQQTEIGTLRLLFDRVSLPQKQQKTKAKKQQKAKSKKQQIPQNYVKLGAIADDEPQVPYPLSQESAAIKDYQQEVQHGIQSTLSDENHWYNLSLLMLLLEKYGSCLRFGKFDVAIIDAVRMVAATAASLAERSDADDLCLIAGDLSGIQNFIYTISSDGALKSLRARSFYLELLTEEIVQQLLAQLKLPRTNVIYAGGGNLYLLAPASQQTQDTVRSIRQQLNQWLFEEFQGKISLALEQLDFPAEHIGTARFANHWEAVIKKLAQQKQQKFRDRIDRVLKPRISYEQCRVCHRDDVPKLTPLDQDSIVPACPTCARMFRLGRQLLHVRAIVRSEQVEATDRRIRFKLPGKAVYYRLFDDVEAALQAQNSRDQVFLINNWTPKLYQAQNITPLLLGNYGQDSKEEFEQSDPRKPGMMRAEEFAQLAQGMKRVGYLRMDVDRLGQIFAEGLGIQHSLPRLAGLSRQMSYFFKVYLNQLAKQRNANLLFIYAGGDDLFISGCWNEIVDFAFEVYRSFRNYTGDNPDITLSGGISLAGPKFPLYQAAAEAGKAEHHAKENGRDSLGLFGESFKWSEWSGTVDLTALGEVLGESDSTYLQPETKPHFLGVLPLVDRLNGLLSDQNLARSFVRNLLLTAQLQEQAIEEYKKRHQPEYSSKENEPKDLKDLRYYLHLPKIAYTLARSPASVRDDPDLRESFLSPYNAPYFRAIATWIEFLNRSKSKDFENEN